jgi:uncharacterized protein (DUF885 family)
MPCCTLWAQAVPGHHFQLSVAQSLKELPQFRRVVPFTAYAEGWALYAEQLVRRMRWLSRAGWRERAP